MQELSPGVPNDWAPTNTITWRTCFACGGNMIWELCHVDPFLAAMLGQVLLSADDQPTVGWFTCLGCGARENDERSLRQRGQT